MDDRSHGTDLTALATATSFLCTIVMAIFGTTDILGGESCGAGELCAAMFSAVAFAVLLAR